MGKTPPPPNHCRTDSDGSEVWEWGMSHWQDWREGRQASHTAASVTPLDGV